MKYNKEMLLAIRQKAQEKMQQLIAQASIEMTYELENNIETLEAVLDEIKYGLEYLEHSNETEVRVLINEWA